MSELLIIVAVVVGAAIAIYKDHIQALAERDFESNFDKKSKDENSEKDL